MVAHGTSSPEDRSVSKRSKPSAQATPAESDNRRLEPRFPYQTVVTMVTAGATSEAIKCWTRDLSPSGARILTFEPITAARLLLRFLLPNLGSQLIEAKVVSCQMDRHIDMHNRSTPLYLYGVKFTNVLGTAAAAET